MVDILTGSFYQGFHFKSLSFYFATNITEHSQNSCYVIRLEFVSNFHGTMLKLIQSHSI